MNKLNFLLAGLVSLVLIGIFITENVSAYSHSYFEVSDRIDYDSHISGPDRGFSLQRSTDVPRLTCDGYWDWSARPRPCIVPIDTKLSERTMLEAFRTFQRDSAAQNEIQRLQELRKNPYYFFGDRVIGYGFGSDYYNYYRPTARVYSWGF